MCRASADVTGFDLRDYDGLLWWHYALTTCEASDDELARLREVVLGAAHAMFAVSAHAADIPLRLEEIPSLNVIRRGQRGLEQDPLELCAFRLIPRFYDAQDFLEDADLRNINAINKSLYDALLEDAEGRGVAARFGYVGHQEGVSVVTCAARSADELRDVDADAISDVVAAAVRRVLRADPTVLRIEEEMTRRGIAIAEQQLQECAARAEAAVQECAVPALRYVPAIGDMMNWLWPTAETDEGIRFDLVTSTLRKEERGPLIAAQAAEG